MAEKITEKPMKKAAPKKTAASKTAAKTTRKASSAKTEMSSPKREASRSNSRKAPFFIFSMMAGASSGVPFL